MKRFTRSAALTAAALAAALGMTLVPGAAQADTGWPTLTHDVPSGSDGGTGTEPGTDDTGWPTHWLDLRHSSARPLDTGWPT